MAENIKQKIEQRFRELGVSEDDIFCAFSFLDDESQYEEVWDFIQNDVSPDDIEEKVIEIHERDYPLDDEEDKVHGYQGSK